jgi:hypothetical protein
VAKRRTAAEYQQRDADPQGAEPMPRGPASERSYPPRELQSAQLQLPRCGDDSASATFMPTIVATTTAM